MTSAIGRRDLLRAAVGLPLTGCWLGRAVTRNASHLFESPAPTKKAKPRADFAKLGVTWIGHATVLVQLGPHFVLTDPLLTPTIAQLSKRILEPGILPEDMPPLDAVVISHMHPDHYSPPSLEMIERRIGRLLLPENGLLYAPDTSYPARDLARWQRDVDGSVAITQVPVKHAGWRYVVDAGWMQHGFAGWVLEFGGFTVYFGGDTGYDRARFLATRRRFPRIDLALLPIAPVEPRDIQASMHMGPREALDAFRDLGALRMMPIHYDTFWFGDDKPGDALRALRAGMREKGVRDDEVLVGEVGVPIRIE